MSEHLLRNPMTDSSQILIGELDMRIWIFKFKNSELSLMTFTSTKYFPAEKYVAKTWKYLEILKFKTLIVKAKCLIVLYYM